MLEDLFIPFTLHLCYMYWQTLLWLSFVIMQPKYLYPNMGIKVSKLNYSSHFILYSKAG